jgi:hypothetical protein
MSRARTVHWAISPPEILLKPGQHSRPQKRRSSTRRWPSSWVLVNLLARESESMLNTFRMAAPKNGGSAERR